MKGFVVGTTHEDLRGFGVTGVYATEELAAKAAKELAEHLVQEFYEYGDEVPPENPPEIEQHGTTLYVLGTTIITLSSELHGF